MGQTVNYDESKVGTYPLPDPLLLPDGQKISTSQEWEQEGRPKTLKLFSDHVYGRFPGKPDGLRFSVREVNKSALGGLATRKQVTVYFTNAPDAPSMELLLYLPNNTEGTVPAFVGLNFYGNQSINADPGIIITNRWVKNNETYGITNHRATESSRGVQASRWPVEELMKRGYALVTAYYGDLEPDYSSGWQTGIRTTLKTELGIESQEWGAIGAWSWGLSRIMDYIQTETAINASQVSLTGHSRLGKAALWAGANDQRFALVISNESGEGGAALARRNFGETIGTMNQTFPHWYYPVYKTYNQQPQNLPVDQHQLLALIAPRPLYVCSATEDLWSDPKGEFLSAYHAGSVYQLYNQAGVGASQMPPADQPVGATIRYHNRTGQHAITLYDWQQHLAFVQTQFNLVTLKLLTTGSGSVGQTPKQINYIKGASVTLAATPATGYKFTGWSGSATGTTNPLTVTMTGNKTITANFALLSGQKVERFNLINANTNAVIQIMSEGAVLNLATLPTQNLNIQAVTNPAKVGSVRLTLAGPKTRNTLENSAPYALFGDNAGDYFAWVPAVGSYSLTGTPYTAASGGGTAGTPLKINFKVINQATSARYPVEGAPENSNSALLHYYPNPFVHQFSLQVPGSVPEPVTVKLYDTQGREVVTLEKLHPNQVVRVGQGLKPGVYLLRMSTGTQVTSFRLLKER
ncbi:MAG: Glycoprotein gp2 [uncultured Adhaeribacter sp.]|uniref:Glycoprotein gp2 n=1 Tax=uncultured Adhaeribacter sp. TaxID=448109 RepID=A0A6J4I2C7_9BACT|nr:MAG: Glycoprotein gp2 [uncultured Adhaeribacter sp.]